MMDMVDAPTGADVVAFLGWAEDAELLEQAERHASQITLMARSYTRGKGVAPGLHEGSYEVAEDIHAVIVSATARSLSNPEQVRRTEAGSFSSLPGSAGSWSLLEAFVLNGYRRRAG